MIVRIQFQPTHWWLLGVHPYSSSPLTGGCWACTHTVPAHSLVAVGRAPIQIQPTHWWLLGVHPYSSSPLTGGWWACTQSGLPWNLKYMFTGRWRVTAGEGEQGGEDCGPHWPTPEEPLKASLIRTLLTILSYSLQSRSRESVSYTDAHTLPPPPSIFFEND